MGMLPMEFVMGGCPWRVGSKKYCTWVVEDEIKRSVL